MLFSLHAIVFIQLIEFNTIEIIVLSVHATMNISAYLEYIRPCSNNYYCADYIDTHISTTVVQMGEIGLCRIN